VAVVVVTTTLAAERVLFGERLPSALRSVGLGRPRTAGLAVAAVVGTLLVLTMRVSIRVLGVRASVSADACRVLPGVLAHAGIAEEVLFRGYLFGALRSGRSFWRAVGLSTLPFAAVHLGLFTTLPPPIAALALALSVSTSVPLAHLFELGGRTIWARALLHAVIQVVPKIVTVPFEASGRFTVAWMAACALVPWLSLFVGRRSDD
jgi:membrane protease YdiL (CAAX protease family)